MALLGIIRRWHLRDKVPLREIAKRLGICRNTVRRYLRSETTEPAYAERQTTSAIDPYAHQLAGWLKTEAAKSRKQRRSLKQLHEELVDLGLGVLRQGCGVCPAMAGGSNRVGHPLALRSQGCERNTRGLPR